MATEVRFLFLKIPTPLNNNPSLPVFVPSPAEVSASGPSMSIFSQLKRSSYGIFKAVMETLNIPLQTNKFKLPQVIVIGSESVGKSSLLEGITKGPVFPRARSQCTKMPIRLRLTHVAKAEDAQIWIEYNGNRQRMSSRQGILANVKEIMESLGDYDCIKSTEIVISISEMSACKVGRSSNSLP